MVSEPKLESRTSEEILEMPLIELAYQVLSSTNEPHYYRDLMKKVAEWRKMSDVETADTIAKLYTDINIDGRFVCTGDNVWGLKRWYPIERTSERGASKRFVRKEVVDDDDIDVLDDEYEIEEEDLIEEEPFVFEDEETLDDDVADEEEIDFLEKTDDEDELDEEDQELEEEEDL